jgi:phospholipase/carboxylesterase
MNRLFADHALATPSISTMQSSCRPPRPSSRRNLQQCVLAPLHYEPNYAYPVVVWLHGTGGDERELKRVMPLVSLRNYVSLSVRGTCPSQSGYTWSQSADAVLTAAGRVADVVAQARQRFHVHPSRVFLAGYGSGGTMALRLALAAPDRYAGAASIGGCFPIGHAPLAGLAAARRARLLMMHCRDSHTYSVDTVCDELSLFHAAGMSVTLRQYPCGDELTTQMLRDLDVWLMEQVTGVCDTSDCEATPLPSEWN